jgi:hypothetical protein
MPAPTGPCPPTIHAIPYARRPARCRGRALRRPGAEGPHPGVSPGCARRRAVTYRHWRRRPQSRRVARMRSAPPGHGFVIGAFGAGQAQGLPLHRHRDQYDRHDTWMAHTVYWDRRGRALRRPGAARPQSRRVVRTRSAPCGHVSSLAPKAPIPACRPDAIRAPWSCVVVGAFGAGQAQGLPLRDHMPIHNPCHFM